MQKIFLLLSFFILTTSLISAQEDQNPKELKVGYAGSAPFVIHNENEEGIVFDIWKEIAFDLSLKYTTQEFSSVDAGIKAVQNNEVDILLGPITINEDRASLISFSQPYFDTEMAILAPVTEPTIWDRISPIFSSTFLIAVLGFLLILTLVGFVFWLVEGRRFKEEYGEKIHQGIGSGVWLAIVTMTTVGYGDLAPKTTGGRVVMGSWMVISLILATSFIAGIATTLAQTAPQDKTITSLQQLENKRVAVPDYKQILDKVRNVDGTPIAVSSVTEGYQMLLDKKVDALIYDEIPLQYVFEKKRKDEFVLTKKKIEPQYYGFALPIGSKLKRKVDLQIIHLQQTNEIINIVKDWVSKN